MDSTHNNIAPPNLKYYAFDWDDNIVSMPTQTILKDKDGKPVGISTSDYAKHRSKIGKEPFEYNNHTIVGFDEEPFRNFKTKGDKNFIIDAMLATPGPSWGDFVEAINNGSVFAIITARGHNPNTIKEAVFNYIMSGYKGINKKELVSNLKKFRKFMDKDNMKDSELIKHYLDLCKFYPIYFDSDDMSNPEQLKVQKLEEFIEYIKNISAKVNKKAYLKNDVKNFFTPSIGFSDDDEKNVESVKNHFQNKPNLNLKVYNTGGGEKKMP